MAASASSTQDLTVVRRALSGFAAFPGLDRAALEWAGFDGLSSDHVRVVGRGLLVRLPRLSPWGLGAEATLAYQAAAFGRAAPSAHTPRLIRTIPRSDDLPSGGLVVSEIVGRKPRLPADLPAIAAALRAIHRLPVPPTDDRAPLLDPADPLAHLIETIDRQAPYLDDANLVPDARAQVNEELDWAHGFAHTPPGPPPPSVLVMTDTHPGNFVIDDKGKAWFVDLEKALYGLVAVDLAHATLYTSTRFDPAVAATLAAEDVARFHRAYLSALPEEEAGRLVPWIPPIRRLVWLRTLTWFAQWRVRSAAPDTPWSRARLRPALLDHISGHVEDCLDPATIRRVRAEWLKGDPADILKV